MKLLGRYHGKNGKIEIVECFGTARVFISKRGRQSQATPDGESVFTYVKLMDKLLHGSKNIRGVCQESSQSLRAGLRTDPAQKYAVTFPKGTGVTKA